MKFSRLSDAVLNRNSVWAVLLVLIIFLYAGCGGNDSGQVLPNVTGADKVTSFGDLTKVTVKDMALTDKNADEYYDRLEKILNGEYSALAGGPQKAAGTPYLMNMTLSIKTDEVQALAAYDLATKITATANFSDGTTEIVTPAWMVYSGPATLVNNIYTAQAAAGQTVFIAYYTSDGVTRFAIFRLAVNSMSLLNLSLAADAVQASGNYDLNSITVYAKSSNGASKDVTADPNTKWSLLSGRGTLNGNIYTAPAMADTAIFLVQYTEAGVIESAQFTLKINGLTSISLSKTTDEIQLPGTYDLASELVTTAKYSSGSTQEVTRAPGLIWTLTTGSGTLAGTVYTPSAKVETAVFAANYTESGITKAATFQLKVIGLSSLSLNKTTDEIQSCANYSLADNLILTDKLSNGTTTNRTMDPNTKWTLVSGYGALNGMVYTAPARAETAVIAASYTEAGITKTINFRLRVNALISLTLSKTTDETQILTPYDLPSKLAVYAKFSSGQTKEVTTNPNLRWTISFGSGMLNGSIYTTPERIETATLVATYTENGVAQSARFSLKVSATAPGTKVLLVGLTINKTTDSVQLFDGTYDLGTLAATGKYSNNTTREVALSWIVTSGGGSVAGNIYTAPANVGTVQLMGSCTAEDGSVKSVYFILKAANDTIDKVSALIGPEGGSLTLKNGIALEIYNGSMSIPTLVSLLLVNDNTIEYPSSQNVIRINSERKINSGIIKIPIIESTTTDKISMVLITQDNKLIKLTGNVDNSSGYFTVDLNQFVNINQSSASKISYSATEDRYDYTMAIDRIDNEFKSIIINQKKVDDLKMPFYKQYYNDCWAPTWLMLLKGYKGSDLNNKFNTIYKIHHQMCLAKDEGIATYMGHQLYYVPIVVKWIQDNVMIPIGVIPDVTVTHSGYFNIENKTKELTGFTFAHRNFYTDYSFARYIIQQTSKKIPVMVFVCNHVFLILGYEIPNSHEIPNYNDFEDAVKNKTMKFIVHHPHSDQYYKSFTFNTFDTFRQLITGDKLYITYSAYSGKPLLDSNKLISIQMPDNEILFKNNSTEVSNVEWDHLCEEGYKLTNARQYNEISEFDSIHIKNINIYNTSGNSKNCVLTTKITNSGTEIYYKTEEISIDKGYLYSSVISTLNFKKNWKKIGSDYIVDVSLSLVGSNNKLDGFDFNFKYKPLLVDSVTKIGFVGNSFLFDATIGTQDVTGAVTWKVNNPDNNIDCGSDGSFYNGILKTRGEISTIKEYTISASYIDDYTTLSTKTAEVTLKLLPGITPSKKAMCVGQSFQFKLGTEILENSSDYITWNATGGTINQDGYFTATNAIIGSPEIWVTLKKGATIKSDKSDETTETTLVTRPVTLQILDLSIKPDKTLIDFNKTTNFQLTNTIGGSVYSTNTIDWSATSGTVDTSEIIGNSNIYMKYKPSMLGKSIISAKLKKGILFGPSLLVEDVEKTLEVTVVEIKVLEPMPLIAYVEPIDALGRPMNNYRTETEFSVSVDGATVPIILPYSGSKGTIELIGTSDINTLPVIHKFKYTPPKNLNPAPYYFGGDDTLYVDIKSTAFDIASTSAVIAIYKPVFRNNVTTKYESKKISAIGDYVEYTTGKIIYIHGNHTSYWDNANNTPERSGRYEYGQNIGIHLYNGSDGVLGGWYNYDDPNYLHAQATAYYFETTGIMPPVPMTRTVLFNLIRDSIDVPYTYTIVSTRFTPGWEPPPDTLPPAQ